MDVTDGYSNWPNYVARPTKRGGVTLSSTGSISCEDEYTVVLPWGERPQVLHDIDGLPELGDHLPEFQNGLLADDSSSSSDPDDPIKTAADLVVNEISWDQPDPTSRVWVATVTYGLPDGSNEITIEGHRIKNEFTNVSYRTWSEAMVKDSEGTAVVNTAGDPFDQPVNVERLSPVIEVIRKEGKAMTKRGLAASGTINSAAITVAGQSIPARHGRIYVSAQELDNNTAYDYQSTYRIEINPDGWDMSVLSQGYNCYLGTGSTQGEKITPLGDDADGYRQPLTTPILLDANGHRTTTPFYRTFKPYAAASWANLNLPSSL